MSRIERRGSARLIDLDDGPTLVVVNERFAAYEGSGDAVAAARAAVDTAYYSIDDKFFITRWLELVGAQDRKPERKEKDVEPPVVGKESDLEGF